MAEHTQTNPTSEKVTMGESSHQENADGIRMEVLQESVALDIARRTSPPQPWSLQMGKLYAVVTVAYLCSALNGTTVPRNPFKKPTDRNRF